jgi:hypothetical protein
MSDVRTDQRDMRRIGRILNEAFGIQANTMCWEVLEEAPRLRDGVFEVRVHTCSKNVKDEPIVPPDTSASTKKIFVSLNRCRRAVLWNTGWLSVLARGKHSSAFWTRLSLTLVTDLNFEIIERDLFTPKPTHPFVMHRPGGGMTFSKDYFHTVFLFRPDGSSDDGSSGIVVDPSHAQYQFEHGVDTVDDYMGQKTIDSSYQDEPFGDTMMEVRSKGSDTKSSWSEHMNEAISGVTNNIIMAEMQRLGGVPALMSISDQAFEKALHGIIALLEFDLVELRQDLEVAMYEIKDELDNFKFFWDTLNGEGNRLCAESLERVISQLETLAKYKSPSVD